MVMFFCGKRKTGLDLQKKMWYVLGMTRGYTGVIGMKLSWKTCLQIGLSVFFLYLCIHYWTDVADVTGTLIKAASPLLIGCVVAYIVNILMTFYEKFCFRNASTRGALRLRRAVCIVLAFLTLFALVALIVWLTISQLVPCVQLILAELPGFLENAAVRLREWGILPEEIAASILENDWRSQISQIVQMVSAGLGSVVDVLVKTVSLVFSGVVSALLSLFFAIYLLASKEVLVRQIHRVITRYLKEAWYQKFMHVLGVFDECFHRFIVGQCTEAVILGVLCALGMWILRLPYAAMIGALTAFTALIPLIGSYVGCVVGAFMIFTQSPVKAVVFIIFLIVLQQIEGNLIYPKVVGNSIGLPGIWVLAAVTVGGGVLGVTGMLIGVPFAAALYRLLREDVQKGEKEPRKTSAANSPGE